MNEPDYLQMYWTCNQNSHPNGSAAVGKRTSLSKILRVQNAMALNVHLHSGLLLSAINLIPFPFCLQLLIWTCFLCFHTLISKCQQQNVNICIHTCPGAFAIHVLLLVIQFIFFSGCHHSVQKQKRYFMTWVKNCPQACWMLNLGMQSCEKHIGYVLSSPGNKCVPRLLEGASCGQHWWSFSTELCLISIFLATFVPQRKQSSMK